MASIFWFEVSNHDIDITSASEAPFAAWVTDNYGQDNFVGGFMTERRCVRRLLSVLFGPQEPPFVPTDDCPF
jgi:hypothetical protein